MTTASLVWIIIFAVAAFLFFGTAVAITVVGVRDLKELLRKSETSE